jgi:hypothetical protein
MFLPSFLQFLHLSCHILLLHVGSICLLSLSLVIIPLIYLTFSSSTLLLLTQVSPLLVYLTLVTFILISNYLIILSLFLLFYA